MPEGGRQRPGHSRRWYDATEPSANVEGDQNTYDARHDRWEGYDAREHVPTAPAARTTAAAPRDIGDAPAPMSLRRREDVALYLCEESVHDKGDADTFTSERGSFAWDSRPSIVSAPIEDGPGAEYASAETADYSDAETVSGDESGAPRHIVFHAERR